MRQFVKKMILNIARKWNKRYVYPNIKSVGVKDLLKGKVALITGGTGGIGSSIADTFIKSGCKVILVSRNEQKLKLICQKYTKDVISCVAFDLTNLKDLGSLLTTSVGKFGKIDILVNSAGTHTPHINFWTVTEEEYDRVLNTNLKGTYFLSRAIGRYMRDNGIKGHILNISSSTSGEPSWSPYRISKKALGGVTEGLAMLFEPFNIIVNGIAPGEVSTSLVGWHEGKSIDSQHNHLGRMIVPQEVANLSLFLVSSMGDMIVGDTIYISGGRGVFDIR